MALFEAGNPANPYVIPALALQGDLEKFLGAGWDLDWMTDPYNIDRAAVFGSLNVTDSAGAIYQEILAYYRDYGIVPTRARIESSFPPPNNIPWDTEITAEEAIGEANRQIRTVRTSEFLNDVQYYLMDGPNGSRNVEADDIPALTALAEKFTRKLQASGPAVLPFRLLSLADIDNLPDPEILIDGLIDHGTVTKLVGESGKGKSFVAIDWSLCIAAGRRWQGRKVRKGRVLYIAAEGAYGLKKRIQAWKRTYGDVPDESFKLIPDAVQLADAGQLQALIKVARDFDVVVIDTLARTSAGLEENSAKDMGVYIDNCYKIRDAAREAGATVLVVHHTGYDTKRARGSSALFANGDGEILIESDDPHEFMTMTVKKRKDGEAGQQLFMHLATVDCCDWTSCVVEGMDEPAPEQTNAEKVLDAIRDGAETQAGIATATGLNVGTVSRELSKLLDAGQVVKYAGRPVKYSVA
jgi:AAA domain